MKSDGARAIRSPRNDPRRFDGRSSSCHRVFFKRSVFFKGPVFSKKVSYEATTQDGNACRRVHRVSATWIDVVRRSSRISWIFQNRVRRTTEMAERSALCRPGGIVPIPSWPGIESSRHCHRFVSGRLSWRRGCVDRVYAAVCIASHYFCRRLRDFRRWCRERMVTRIEGLCGRGWQAPPWLVVLGCALAGQFLV